MRLLEGCSTLYTGSAFRVSVIGAKLVCLSITSKQARVAPECCHAILGWRWRCPLTACFDFKLAHCPGHSMGKPDMLLQRLDHGKGASDNEDVVLLRLELLAI